MRRPSSIQNNNFGYLWENGIGCPIGTVPIKRITKDKLHRLNVFSDKYKPQGSWNFTYNQYNVDNYLHHHVSGIIFVIFQTEVESYIYYSIKLIKQILIMYMVMMISLQCPVPRV